MKRLALVGWAGFFFASFLLASETEAGHQASAWVDFAGKLVNFLILFGGLGYFLYRPVRSWIRNRAFLVQKTLAEAASERQKAEQELSQLTQRLTGLKEELLQLRQKAEEEGRKEKARILALAEEEAARIQKLTALEVEALTKGAIREIKGYAASLATSLAEARIKAKLSPALHRRLIRRSIERLEKLHEGPNPR